MSSHHTIATWVRRGSLAAGIAYTATAEYELARRLGASVPVAVMLPVAIDCYLVAALRWFRAFDIALSLTLMCAAQVAAHALDAGVLTVTLEMVAVVSLLVPVAIWRTHALARQTPKDTPVPAPSPAVDRMPVEEPAAPPAPLDRPAVQDTLGTPALPAVHEQDTQDAVPSPPVPITAAEVAARAGVDPSTVRSWVHLGRLTVLGKDERGRNLFDPEALDAMLAGATS